MSTDDVIEAAARRLYASDGLVPLWDEQYDRVRELYLSNARALAQAGLIVSELPVEPLPVWQPRLDPSGVVWQRRPDGKWSSHMWPNVRKDDDDVRDWPILVPEADRAEVEA